MKKIILLVLPLLFLALISCEEEDISGCTDPISSNFNPEAIEDDGSCNYFYGGRDFGQLDIGSEVDSNNQYDIYFNNEFIGRSLVFFPNGLSCGEPQAVGRIMPAGQILVRAVGNGATEIREGLVSLNPQECKVFLIENLPLVNGGGGGGGNGLGNAVFWINADYGCGPVTVNLAGVGSATITNFFSSAPNCGASGAANFSNLAPGSYNFTASCNNKNWGGTVNISANTCSTQLLLPDGNGGGGGGGGGGGNGLGNAVFWINADYGCGPVTVNLAGVGSATITNFFGNAPNCGASGAANFSNLAPGSYNFTASCNNKNWSGSINITANTCTSQLLLPDGNGGGGGGGGNSTGDVIFWVNQDFGCGPITVNVNGVGSSTITGFFDSGVPDCTTTGAGGNFNNLPPGTYSFSASCSNRTWNSNFTVTANSCLRFQLN